LGVNSYSKERLEILEAQRKFRDEFDPDNEEHVAERKRQIEVYDEDPKLGWYLYGIARHSKKYTDECKRQAAKKRYYKMSKEKRSEYYQKLKEKKRREKERLEQDLVRRKDNPHDRLSYPKEEEEFIGFVWETSNEFKKYISTMKALERGYKNKINAVVVQLRQRFFWTFEPRTVPMDLSLKELDELLEEKFEKVKELTFDPEADKCGVPLDLYKQQYMRSGDYFSLYKTKVERIKQLTMQLENDVVDKLFKAGKYQVHPIFVFKWAAEWGLYRVGEVIWRRCTKDNWSEEGCFAFTKEEFVEKAKKVELCSRWQEQIERSAEDVRDKYTDSLVAIKMFKKFVIN
jgi:hypothetical protein